MSLENLSEARGTVPEWAAAAAPRRPDPCPNAIVNRLS
jgi:hypothetical protein